jgi:hypothetical protein
MDLNEIVIKGVKWIALSQQVADCYDDSNEPSSSIRCGEFMGLLHEYLLLNDYSSLS